MATKEAAIEVREVCPTSEESLRQMMAAGVPLGGNKDRIGIRGHHDWDDPDYQFQKTPGILDRIFNGIRAFFKFVFKRSKRR
jgi:hypothetical protein